MGIRQRPDDGDGWVEIDLNRMSEPDKAEESEYSPHRDCLTLQKAQYGALTHTAGSVPVTVHNSRIVLKYYCKIKTSTTWAMNNNAAKGTTVQSTSLYTQKYPAPDNCREFSDLFAGYPEQDIPLEMPLACSGV